MVYDALIFDIDGTLWDATGASARAWTDGLASLGIPRVVTVDDIRVVTGRPADECIRHIVGDTGMSSEVVYDVLDRYEREYIERDGGQLYPHVREGITRLSAQYAIGLVSNCTDWYLRDMQRFLAVGQHVTDALSWGDTLEPKSANIRTIAARNGWERVAYIGDTKGDESAAREAGVDFFGVTYGFGSPEGIVDFTDFEELVEYFLGRRQD